MKTRVLKVKIARVLLGLAIGVAVCFGIPLSAKGGKLDDMMNNVNNLPEKLKQATNEYGDKIKESAKKLGENIVTEANAVAAEIERQARQKADEIMEAAQKEADAAIKQENDKRAKQNRAPLTDAEKDEIRKPILEAATRRVNELIAEAKRFADEIRSKAQATQKDIDSMSAQLEAEIANVWASNLGSMGDKVEKVLNLVVDFERMVLLEVDALAKDIPSVSTNNTDLLSIKPTEKVKELADKIKALRADFAKDCEDAQDKYDKTMKDGLGGDTFTDLGDEIDKKIKKLQDKINELMNNMVDDDDDSMPDEGNGAKGHDTIDLCEFLQEIFSGGGNDDEGGFGGAGALVKTATGWIRDKAKTIEVKIADMRGSSGGGLSDSLRSKVETISNALQKLASGGGGGLADSLNLPVGKDGGGASGQPAEKKAETWRTRLN